MPVTIKTDLGHPNDVRILAVPRAMAMVLILLLAFSSLPVASDGDRASESLHLEGYVHTGDGAATVRAASVQLVVYDGTGAPKATKFNVSNDLGHFNFWVIPSQWDPGWNATLRASYTQVGVTASKNFTLTSGAHQWQNVTIPWNRTLGMQVSVDRELKSTPRGGQPTYVINVTNGGNDTDNIELSTMPSNDSILSFYNPGDEAELAPGESMKISLQLMAPGLGPGDYDVRLTWNSVWFGSQSGSIDLTWRVESEVDLSVPALGVVWWPDPALHGENVLLNCSVVNTGRDPAPQANVTMELDHPVNGLVLRDKVRLDVAGKSVAVASFPWTAVHSDVPYLLSFTVEHPWDKNPGNDNVEVELPINVSNEPPVVEFTSPANGSHANGTAVLRLRVTDPDTSVDGVFLRIDGGEWIELPNTGTPTYPWDTTEVSDGWHVLEAYAVDRFSVGAVTRHELKVDNLGPNHPPAIFIEAPREGDTVADPLMTMGIAFDEDDYVERVEIRIDGGEWVLAEGANRWSANLSTTSLVEGAHLLEVRAFDGIDLSETESVLFHITDLPVTSLRMSLEVDPATVLPGEVMTVKGDLVYDNGVRASEVQVRIEGPNGLLEFKTSDVRGFFELTTTAPSQEGRYDYTASGSDDGGLAASNTTQLRVLKSLDPDLAVVAVRVESEKVAVGTNVTIGVDLRNFGFKSGNGTLKAWAGPVGTGDPVEERFVTVYDSITVSFVWVPEVDGEVDLTIEVVSIQPGDVNASNNRLVEVVTVLNLPDLSVSSLVFSNPSPYDNTTITVSVRVVNTGGLNATCTVKLYMDEVSPDGLLGDSDVAVFADSFAHATFEVKVTHGPHRIHAEILNTYPDESRTDNNMASRQLEVKGPFEPSANGDDNGSPIPLPGTGLALLALIVASLAVARLGHRRR
jgi:hypothetical protein